MVQSIRIESTTLHRQNVRIIRVNHGRILVRLFLPLGDLFTIETAIYNDYQRLMLNCFFFIWFGLVWFICNQFSISVSMRTVQKGGMFGVNFLAQKMYFCFQLINHDLWNECESPHYKRAHCVVVVFDCLNCGYESICVRMCLFCIYCGLIFI